MATIKARIRSDGSRSYRVVWREGGGRDGSWESETFSARSDAGRFCRAVDSFGQCWPEGWIKGVGYSAPTPPAAAVPSFVSFAQSYVRDLTGITPATRHRYDRQVLALDGQLRILLLQEPDVGNVEDVHIRRWVNAREAAGASPKTIANYHGLLFMIFASAVSRGFRPGNPCAGTRLPDRYAPDGEDDHDVVFLTERQFGCLLTRCSRRRNLLRRRAAAAEECRRALKDLMPERQRTVC